MSTVYIVAAKRSAIGSFGGTLAPLGPVDLGVSVARATLNAAGVTGESVAQLIAGNVLGAGHGMNLARQVSLGSGLSESSTAFCINMVCGSGLQSVRLAAQSILAGDCDLVLAGGVESMSQAAFVSLETRFGARMGDASLTDLMLQDGLTDAFDNGHMGCTAENIAKEYGISREEQDEFAAESQRKAGEAIKAGYFEEEIAAVEVASRKSTITFSVDEYPRTGTSVEKLAALRPAFSKDGSVTAGNASGINDGAAFLLLASESAVKGYALKPIARIVGSGVAGVSPAVMGLGPTRAVPIALAATHWDLDSVDCIESNEAFAVQAIAVSKELGLSPDKVNNWGGAIALGHPIGASGARILVTLLHRMKAGGVERGLATLCVGGGQGVACLVESCA